MKILRKNRLNTSKSQKKKKEMAKSFDDIIIIGDEDENADLQDIEIIPGTKEPGKSILTARGEFIYDVSFVIDSEDALSESVTAVEISFYRKRPKKRKIYDGSTSDDIRNAFLKKKRRRSKTSLKDGTVQITSAEKPITVAVISLGEEFVTSSELKKKLETINSKIDKLKQIAPKQKVKVRTSKVRNDFITTKVTPRKVSLPKPLDVSLVGLKTLSGVPAKLPSSNKNLKVSKKKLRKKAQKKGTSPIKVGKALFPIVPESISQNKDSSVYKKRKKNTSYFSSRKTSFRQIKNSKSITSNRLKPVSIEDREEIKKIQRAQQKISSLNKLKNTIENEIGEIEFETRMISYDTSIGLNLSVGLPINLYMKVRLIHDSNRPGEYVYLKVNHKEQVDDLLTPEEAPDLKGSSVKANPSKIVLKVAQNDDISNEVILQRRKITDNTEDDEYSFQEITRIKVSSDTGAQTYEDTGVSNVFPVSYEYRAIPVGPTGVESDDLVDGTIVTGIKPIGHSASSYVDPDNNVAISAINKYDRIGLTVESIPDDVVAIRLFKEDLVSDSFYSGRDLKFKEVIPVGQNSSVIRIGEGVNSVYIEDFDVTPEKTYRYKCTLRRLREPEAEGNEEEIIKHIRPRVRTPIDASIEDLKFDVVGKGAEITFNLVAEFSDPGLELLKQIFDASGVSGNFIEDFRNNRERLKEVPAFFVTRVDLYTGRSTKLGLFPPGEFKDDAVLQASVGTHIIPGRKYRYVAKLAIRPPSTFFKDAVTTIDVQNKSLLGLSEKERFDVLSQRFLTGFGAMSGMPSESDIKNIEELGIEGQFALGMTGIEVDVEVSAPSNKPKIKKARASKRKYYNIVEWVVDGDIRDINYFTIQMKKNGSVGIIGTVTARNRSSYVFKDKIYADDIGVVSYSITPVYNDMSQGSAFSTNSVTVDRNVSSDIFKRLVSRKVEKGKTK